MVDVLKMFLPDQLARPKTSYRGKTALEKSPVCGLPKNITDHPSNYLDLHCCPLHKNLHIKHSAYPRRIMEGDKRRVHSAPDESSINVAGPAETTILCNSSYVEMTRGEESYIARDILPVNVGQYEGASSGLLDFEHDSGIVDDPMNNYAVTKMVDQTSDVQDSVAQGTIELNISRKLHTDYNASDDNNDTLHEDNGLSSVQYRDECRKKLRTIASQPKFNKYYSNCMITTRENVSDDYGSCNSDLPDVINDNKCKQVDVDDSGCYSHHTSETFKANSSKTQLADRFRKSHSCNGLQKNKNKSKKYDMMDGRIGFVSPIEAELQENFRNPPRKFLRKFASSTKNLRNVLRRTFSGSDGIVKKIRSHGEVKECSISKMEENICTRSTYQPIDASDAGYKVCFTS